MNIKFQDKLLEAINNFNLDSLPHSILLRGHKGSGKHLIINYISQKFNLPLINISEDLNEDLLDELYSKSTPHLCLVDIQNMTIKGQNSLLKALEEPSPYLYFILPADEKDIILPTVENRCFPLIVGSYSEENLKEFISKEDVDKDLILSLSKTPGEVLFLQNQDLKGMKELAHKMVYMMGKASFPNALSISDKIAYKNEKNKYELLTFIDIYRKELADSLKENYTLLNSVILCKTNNLIYMLRTRGVNQKYLFENFITTLWKLSQSKVENNGN